MTITIAAVGDVHSAETPRPEMKSAFARASEEADLLLLCGDLTRRGLVTQAQALLAEIGDIGVPVVAVLGNHDFHKAQQAEIADVLREAGVTVLDGESVTLSVGGASLSVAGTKGFGGGFGIHALPDFGEPVLRKMYEEMMAEGLKLERALRGADGDVRVVMTHYAPVSATLQGEDQQIWAFLGSSRLAEVIDSTGADIAFHGHSHYGVRRGLTLGGVPVHNVSLPVIDGCYALFEVGK